MISNDILVVIVVYREPVAGVLRHVLPVPAARHILIYDNSENPQETKDLPVVYIHDPRNDGVSKAYNRAFSVAKSRGLSWLLLFDQDTACTTAYLDEVESFTGKGVRVPLVPRLKDRVGFVSPFKWSWRGGRRIDPTGKDLPLKKFRFANSGLLIHVDTFARAGGYDEGTPLDFSDIRFGEKLQSVCDHFQVASAVLQHKHSSSSATSRKQAVQRFRFFSRGAVHLWRQEGFFSGYALQLAWRCLKLSFRYKTVDFVVTFRESFMR